MKEFFDAIKDCAFFRVTQSRLVESKPAYLFAAHLIASNVGAGTAGIYNGHTDTGDLLVDLSAPHYSRDRAVFIPPLFFSRGIYVSIGSNVVSVVLQFRQTGDLEKAPQTDKPRSWLPSWLRLSPREPKST